MKGDTLSGMQAAAEGMMPMPPEVPTITAEAAYMAILGVSADNIDDKYAEDKAAVAGIDSDNLEVIDVRPEDEFAAGHINNAISIPRTRLETNLITGKMAELIPDKNTDILVYCHSGYQAAFAVYALIKSGYVNAKSFGGVLDWPYGLVTDRD
jgi:rhodanese-related sulfurtransferase